MMGFHMGYGLFGLLLMILFWVGLVFLGVWLVKYIFESRKKSDQQTTVQGPSAKEILDQRYARGEITREQYDLMKSDLSSGQS